MRRANERKRTIWQIVIVKKQIQVSFSCVCLLIGSINSRCFGTKPVLLPEPDSKERRKSSLVLLLTMNFVKTLLKSLMCHWCCYQILMSSLSVTEQTLGHMETICFILYSNKKMLITLSVRKKNQSKCENNLTNFKISLTSTLLINLSNIFNQSLTS